jgi:hypothetical protein
MNLLKKGQCKINAENLWVTHSNLEPNLDPLPQLKGSKGACMAVTLHLYPSYTDARYEKMNNNIPQRCQCKPTSHDVTDVFTFFLIQYLKKLRVHKIRLHNKKHYVIESLELKKLIRNYNKYHEMELNGKELLQTKFKIKCK